MQPVWRAKSRNDHRTPPPMKISELLKRACTENTPAGSLSPARNGGNQKCRSVASRCHRLSPQSNTSTICIFALGAFVLVLSISNCRLRRRRTFKNVCNCRKLCKLDLVTFLLRALNTGAHREFIINERAAFATSVGMVEIRKWS